jgi:hypothetical protein
MAIRSNRHVHDLPEPSTRSPSQLSSLLADAVMLGVARLHEAALSFSNMARSGASCGQM